jgi:hypothetical protein
MKQGKCFIAIAFQFTAEYGIRKIQENQEWIQMVQISATRYSCIAIVRVSLMSFASITLCVASQWVFVAVVYFVRNQSGNLWIHLRMEYISSWSMLTILYWAKRNNINTSKIK